MTKPNRKVSELNGINFKKGMLSQEEINALLSAIKYFPDYDIGKQVKPETEEDVDWRIFDLKNVASLLLDTLFETSDLNVIANLRKCLNGVLMIYEEVIEEEKVNE